jgi:uncharacterized membrane protein YcaP (DUF421 family)
MRSVAEAVGATAAIYAFLIVLMRAFGRRQLDQLTVIDLAVVLLLGSAVETAMIHGNTTLLVGLASAGTLMVLNRVLTVAALRSKRLRHVVNGGPLIVVRDGEVVGAHARRSGLATADLLEAVHDRGFADLSQVAYAVLETDGTISVLGRPSV